MAHDQEDMVSTRELVEHMVRVSRRQDNEHEHIKYDHMLRELATVASHNNSLYASDPGSVPPAPPLPPPVLPRPSLSRDARPLAGA